VQARLAACAVALEEAARAGDSAGQIAALQNAEDALRFRLFDDSPSTPRDLPEVLAAAAAPWEGLVDIRLETSGEQPSPEATDAIEQVVEEAITNAVRHGGARYVVVQVEGSPDGHRITVDDDGRGAHEALPGIGLTLYERVTGGRWELTTSDALAGARLTALVPC
jgi:signal transduction histidine kinase